MNLSKLVYLSIKNAIYYDDASFSFDNFKKDLFNGDPDYATNINNVFLPLNEAIARLSDLERIPYKTIEISQNDFENGFYVINLRTLEQRNNIKIKEVINVVKIPSYEKIEHKNMGIDKILLMNRFGIYNLYMEVKEDIPHFDSTSYYYKKDDEDTLEEYDVNLADYGINDSMCNYIMEYVMGRLTEQISPEIANMHITRAEQYFANIKPNNSNLTQRQVKNVYKIGE